MVIERGAFTVRVLGLAAIYIAVARFGLGMDAVSGFATLVWPAAGIALAALVRGGVQYWPAVAIGALAINLWAGAPVAAALGIAAGNTLEAVVGATLILRAVGGELSLGRLRGALALILAGALVSTALSASIGTSSLFLAGVVPRDAFAKTWLAWWVGDAIGDLVVAPLLLVSWRRLRRHRERRVEALGLCAAVACAGWLVFGPLRWPASDDLRQAYLLFPVLAWAAMRFQQQGAVLATFALSAIAIAGTAFGHGPFVADTLHERLAALQAFMLVLAATGLLLAASKAQLDAAEASASQARDAAERANRAKDEFLAMLSHELRNPLAPIVTALELMKTRGALVSSRERKIIERQVRHVVALVDDLLDVSRIDRGKIELVRSPVEIADVVARATEMVRPLIEQLSQELVVSVPVRGLVVEGDPVRLAQVFSNLLTNAARCSELGGRIDVTATRVGGAIEVAVRDRGIGITPEVLPRIFDAFMQGPRSLDRPNTGLGLGLALVRGVVELHGGSVDAASEGAGRGSTFTVRLPASGVFGHPEPAAEHLPRTPTRGQRVLIVDDNRDSAEMLGVLLREAGHEVTLAFDPIAALEAAREARPEVAVLDIGLPGMDGYELARCLRTASGCTRFIALTGYGEPRDRARSDDAGFLRHLVKPVDAAALLDAIHATRGGGTPASEPGAR